MTYRTIAQSATDPDLLARIAASAAQEGMVDQTPATWATNHIWEIVSATDIEAAYFAALQQLNPAPGADVAVVTDGMILAKVQVILNPPPPEIPELDPNREVPDNTLPPEGGTT